MRTLVAIASLCAAIYGCEAFSATADWEWRGAVVRGRSVRIRGVTGDIRAIPSGSGEVEVSARIRRDGDTGTIEMQVAHDASGVTICAVRQGSEACADTPLEGPAARVDYQLRVPDGVHLIASTINGGIEAESLNGDVNVQTVNGAVAISTTGTAQARTVNGSIRAFLLKPFWKRAPEFSAVNGGISVHIPANVRTGVRAETRNGRIVADVTGFRGTATEQTLDGAIGRGGGASNGLILRTINGPIELKQRF